VPADAAPDNVYFTWTLFIAVLKCRTPIASPRHFENAGIALDDFDTQAGTVRTANTKVLYHLHHRVEELFLLGLGKSRELPYEASELIVSRHPPSQHQPLRTGR
jgi:hypothetical protein